MQSAPRRQLRNALDRHGLALVVGFGCVLRLVQYLWQRSYWDDEARLLLNIRDKSWLELLGPLDNEQSAPIGFMYACKALITLLGDSELVVRFLPLLAGLISLVLFALLCRRVGIATLPACLATAALALCESTIVYSATLKQYNADIAASLTLLLIAVSSTIPVHLRLRYLALLTLPLALFSTTVVLVFGGLFFALLPQFLREHRGPSSLLRPDSANPLPPALLAAAGFVALYALVLRNQRDESLQEFWDKGFAQFSNPLSIPRWLISETYNHADRLRSGLGALVMLLWVVASMSLHRQRRWQLLFCCIAPVLMTIFVACFHLYPYQGGRVSLFLLPGTALLAAIALDSLFRVARRGPALALVAAMPFVALGLLTSLPALVEPRSRSMIRPAIAHVRQHFQPGDRIYVVAEGKSPLTPILHGRGVEFDAYWPAPNPRVVTGLPRPPAPAAGEGGRFWVVFAFVPKFQLTNMQPLLDDLAENATELDRSVDAGGGAAILYRQRSPTSPPSRREADAPVR
jgi:hypothetical protein